MIDAPVPPAHTHPERELVTARHFPFPRAALLDAFRDGARLARWWGPAGFTNDFEVFEPRPGGLWRFTMIGPDGARYANECRFIELGPDRVVIRHIPWPRFDLAVTLDDVPGGTRLGWCQRFDTEETCDRVKGIAEPANEENLDRLEAELRRG